MNTVPFDQLGPGQSGRLAYQVLGQDGPIFNPQNIRYLSPDSVKIPATSMGAGASALSAGLAGANLIGSVLNLGVSLFNAFQISGLHSEIDQIQATLNRIEGKIDHIVSKVDRIDTQVAENNLRHALNHVLQKAVSHEGIDLRVFVELGSDISKFKESLPSALGLNFGLRLSSDIRDQLQQIYDLAYGIRRLVAQKYNISVDGDPGRLITIDPIEDYFRFGGNLEMLVKTTILYWVYRFPLVDYVPDELGKVDEFFAEWVFLDEFLPEGSMDIILDETIELGERRLYDLGVAWLYQTDAGLLWKTEVELDGIADGYENVFWPQLKEADPCGFNQIEVACDVPLLENT